MSQNAKHDHVDLVTLEEVQRLLADIDFASVDDLRATADLSDLGTTLDAARAAAPPAPPSGGTELSPLPRRR